MPVRKPSVEGKKRKCQKDDGIDVNTRPPEQGRKLQRSVVSR